MKYFQKILMGLCFILGTISLNAQSYKTLWKRVGDNYSNGKVKSNLPIVLQIQKKAQKENNVKELLEALKIEYSILKNTKHDEKNDIHSRFFKKLTTIAPLLKSDEKWLYEVLVSDFIAEYYESNRWRINRRTNVENLDLSSIETWSKLDFKKYLSQKYAYFYKHKGQLKKIPLEPHKKVFSNTENLDYYSNLNDYFSIQYIAFLQHDDLFTTDEQKANQPLIRSIYKNLITESQGNKKVYFQLQLLEFNNPKDKLVQLEKLYSSQKCDYQVNIAVKIAVILKRKKQYVKALNWLSKAQKRYPKSPFLPNLKSLENQIEQSTLKLNFENEIQANKPIHLVAETKNVDDFSVEIFKINNDFKEIEKVVDYYNIKNNFKKIKKQFITKQKFHIQHPKDYKEYATALALQKLKSGVYVLKIKAKNVQRVDYQTVFVSEYRIIDNVSNSQQSQFQLVSRENGQVQPNRTLKVYNIDNEKQSSITTNKKGQFILKGKNYDEFYLLDTQNGDLHQLEIDYRRDRKANKQQKKTQIFLDRAIYRPSQKVYFKVIVTEKENGIKKVVKGEKQSVVLYDTNNKEVSSQTFTTNKFGSYSGHFLLPKGKLNGRFRLKIKKNRVSKSFKVEEYKRPKFEVNFEPINTEYQFGKTIQLKGKAMSYSGIPLTNVKVNYEIKKRDISWRYCYYYPRNYNENSILGTAKTNEKGEFIIPLKLEKEKGKNGIQVMNYRIEASVTDMTGETQTAEKEMKVANVSHYITAQNKKAFFTNEKVEVEVSTKNYNDQNLHQPYQITLKHLDEGKSVIRPNFKNDIQDFPIMSKKEFKNLFPHDIYLQNKKEDGKVILQGRRKGKLNIGKLKAGKYELEIFNIEGKDTIKTKTNFSVWNPKKLMKTQKTFLEILPEKNEYKRNEKAKVYLYSAIPNAQVEVSLQDGFGWIKNQKIRLKNGRGLVNFQMPKNKAVKSILVQVRLVAFNAIKNQKINIDVEEQNEDLKIELLSFRDKIEPNSQEKWRIKVIGKKAEQVNGEILANMYDQSLDTFVKNKYRWRNFKKNTYFNYFKNYKYLNNMYLQQGFPYTQYYDIETPYFSWLNLKFMTEFKVPLYKLYGKPHTSVAKQVTMKRNETETDKANAGTIYGYRSPSNMRYKSIEGVVIKDKKAKIGDIKIRENLNETAFFYPHLYTDKNGELNLEFTSPEALTKWKLMLLAHNQEARSGYLEKEIVTQKQFSITPNYPRFVREGDVLHFKTKISSLIDENLNGKVFLQIIDPITNEDISDEFNLNQEQIFSLAQNGNTLVEWTIKIPENRSLMALKVVAKAGNFSDGEQKALPILPNRILIKESQPIFVKGGQTKNMSLPNFKNDELLSMSLELSTNPIWEVIFALPSLKKDDNSSADVVFNKWFADVLASKIMKDNPKIETVFKQYQNKGLLKSNLEKNQELKQVLLEETPWVLQSKNETEQMEKISRLFDINTMKNEIKTDWRELVELQNTDGGFSWHKGYRSSYTTSLYILKNLGKLNLWLKGKSFHYQEDGSEKMVKQLVRYVDREMLKYWEKDKNVLSNLTLNYLDARRYWDKQYPLNKETEKIKNQLIKASKKAHITDFTFFGLHRMALLMNHYGEEKVANKLLTYLKETATTTNNQGTYWKQNLNNWGWYSSKISNQAGAIEAFQALQNQDVSFIEEMKIWLVTQKEANAWGASKNTAEVIFTMLNSGKSWTDKHSVKIEWGNDEIKENTLGYVKKSIVLSEIKPEHGSLRIENNSVGVVQGGLYWETLQDINGVSSSENYISVTKQLYKKVKTENGEELRAITSETPLKIGDRVVVRMILNTDRAMQFVHIKEMRASGFEPLSTYSGYQWKGGLGFYQNIKDTSNQYFIQYLPKGKYVFEQEYICNIEGEFSNGITTVQNYYAPQMSSHTKGEKVKIEK